jgi:hypothetical protein
MRTHYLAWLFPLLLCCCNKTSPPVTPDPNFNFEYTAEYDSVIAMPANSTYLFIFNINVTNGDINNNKLGCSITGLPGNITVTPASQVVGRILGGVFTFTSGDIPLGIDTLRFTISCPSTGTVIHKLILRIIPPIDYAPKLAINYDSSYDVCLPQTYKHRTIVSVAPDTSYTINISNLHNFGDTFLVRARVSDVIVIPFQKVDGVKVWGRGTYTLDYQTGYEHYAILLNDTMIVGLDTQACTSYIQYK